jgi:pimeloyl-ACP methyl ester carboxylesterase
VPYTVLNGCETYYQSAGQGPPLLFMHGGLGGLGTGNVTREPLPWYEEFVQRYRVITYDRRSSGKSSAPESPHSLELFADDAFELLRYLDLPEAVIWGESGGVAIATTFALRHPQTTTALILSDGAPWFSRDPLLVQRLKERIGLLETAGPEAAYEARRVYGPVGLNVFASRDSALSEAELKQLEEGRAQVRAELSAIGRTERIRMYAAELRTSAAYVDFDATSSLARLSMPILVIYGTRDSVFPSAGWEDLTSDVGNVEYLPFANGGHGCGRQPAAVEAITQFVSRVTG